MPLPTDLPTNYVAGDPDHPDAHDLTNTRVNAVATEVNAHEAATTSVHGIADTSALATSSSVTSAVSTHAAATDPHGDRAVAAAALVTHADDTTSVHGIADTTDLVTTAVTDALDARLDTLDTPTVALTDAATVAIDAAAGPHQKVTVAGDRTIGNPTNGADGRLLTLTILQDATGSRAWTLDTDYRLRSGDTVTPSTTAAARDELAVQYDATDAKWDVLAYRRGDGDAGGTSASIAGQRWRSGDQDTGGFGTIGLNSDTFLYGGCAASGSGISVPADGLYLCVAAISVKAGTPGGGVRNGIFTVNGTDVQEFGLTVASGAVRLSGSAVLSLAADDVVALDLFQNGDTGGVDGATAKDTTLTVTRLGSAA